MKDGPCKEVVERDNPSLDFLPIQTCWPDDGGPFITLPLVITRHPVTGKRNVGMYRMQKFDARTTGMHWQLHKTGAEHSRAAREPFPVAVCLGGDPALTYAATAPLPPEIDEMLFAGWLRGKPVELVKCETMDLEVPADAESCWRATSTRRAADGGSVRGPHRLLHARGAVSGLPRHLRHAPQEADLSQHRRRPPADGGRLAGQGHGAHLPAAAAAGGARDRGHEPAGGGVLPQPAIVSIRKRYPGHAYKVMNALWGLGQMMFSKCIVVVDEDVDVHDPVRGRSGACSNNIDAQRDILFTRGPGGPAGPRQPHQFFGSKMGIDATTKWASEGYHAGMAAGHRDGRGSEGAGGRRVVATGAVAGPLLSAYNDSRARRRARWNMASPFPGMDPYLENPVLWQGFHNLWIATTLRQLQPMLPDHYVATLEMRNYFKREEGVPAPSRVPDALCRGGGTSVPRTAASAPDAEHPRFPGRKYHVDVRDARGVQIGDNNTQINRW